MPLIKYTDNVGAISSPQTLLYQGPTSHFSSLISSILLILHLLVVCYIIIIIIFEIVYRRGSIRESVDSLCRDGAEARIA